MPYEHLVYAVENGRARITLNRPERRNALCPPLLDELERALWDADDDKRVHCVIVRGAGPAFCAGYDLTGFGRAAADDGVPRRGMRSIDDDIWSLEKSNRRIRALWEMHKPSIAQVHGHCLAGGTDLALACDMVIAADDASIGFPPARNLGALPNNLWVYHCGPQWAKRLQLTGDTVSGADAAKIPLHKPATKYGELEIRLDDCKGKVVASGSLEPAVSNNGLTALPAIDLPSQEGTHDICFTFTRAKIDPIWTIGGLELVGY